MFNLGIIEDASSLKKIKDIKKFLSENPDKKNLILLYKHWKGSHYYGVTNLSNNDLNFLIRFFCRKRTGKTFVQKTGWYLSEKKLTPL